MLKNSQLKRGFLIGLACGLSLFLTLPLLFKFSSAWPGDYITVVNTDPEWSEITTNAIEHWNDADVGIKFREISSTEKADVVIRSGDVDSICSPENIACASHIGWRETSPQTTITFPYLDSPDGTLLSSGQATKTMAHELGHVLGLKHRSGCSLMNVENISDCPSGTQQSIDNQIGQPFPDYARCPGKYLTSQDNISRYCPHLARLTYICGPLTADIEAAQRLYGGPGPKPSYNPFCNVLWPIAPIEAGP